MKRLLFPVAVLACLPLAGCPPLQTGQRTFGGTDEDDAYSVQETSDGGYILAGYTSSFGAGGEDMYLVKTDADGKDLWSRTFGGTDGDKAFSVQETSDGGYILAGYYTRSSGAGDWDMYLVKTDANGWKLWSRTFGGTASDYGCSVQETSDGGYILAGWTWSFGAGDADMYLVKTNANGRKLWSRTFGGTLLDSALSVQETSDGGYILAGFTDSFGAGWYDMYLVKTDADGNELWSRTFGGTDSDYAVSVQKTSDGGYILAGHTYSFGAGSGDMYLVKTGANGNELWSRTFGGTDFDWAESVQQTSDGGYILAGSTYSFGAGSTDMYLVKTDANGGELWSRTFGGTDGDGARSVQETSGGGYIIAGATWSYGAGDYDMYLVKTDANGNCNLDIKNPKSQDALEHKPPEELVASTMEKEKRIIELMEEVRTGLQL